MNVLVIGGTGLISTGVVKALKARGASVTVFNRGKTDDRLGDGVRRVTGDREDPVALQSLADAGPWDVVIDMICFRPAQAEAGIRAFAGRCGHFILCSTVCVYGNTQAIIPTTEDTLPEPHSAYGRDKLACERLFMGAHDEGRMKVTIFRPSHTYGPGGGIINNLGWSPAFVDRLRRGLPVIVSGDGHGLWQSAYSEDVGVGFAFAAGRAKCHGEIYNIVGDEVVTWDEYTRRTAAAIGAPEPRIVHIPTDLLLSIDRKRLAALEEIFRFHGVYSSARLKRDVPEYNPSTPYEEGVRRTVAWMDAHGRVAAAADDPFEDAVVGTWNRLCAGLAPPRPRGA
jgi:nucleoside-diphosphate-sugar epimerase